jgi:hypothetical protein
MENNQRNTGALVGGIILIALGALSLFGQVFQSANFWGTVWPLIIVGFGSMFFIGMFAGGKSVSGLAIPGSIITAIGLMLFLQNTFNHFESWSYGWTVIIMSVGLGIFIMGWFGEDAGQRAAGMRVMKIGAILFLIFGAFFEMIFNSWSFSRFIFPVVLIILGGYLILARAGLLPQRNNDSGRSDEKSD